MLNIFKKKDQGTKVIDKIWMTEENKLKALVEIAQINPDTFFVAWFDDSRNQLEEIFTKENLMVQNIISARQCNGHLVQNNPMIFIEHYPLRGKEEKLFDEIQRKEILIYSALDEPLFKRFGGDKIVEMMKQLGMKDTESIENSMISGAIRNAQDKIEKKLQMEQTSRSQNDWLSRNLPS